MSSKQAFDDLVTNYKKPSHPIGFMGIENIYRYYNGSLTRNVIKKYLSSTEVYSMIKQEKKNPRKLWTPIVSFHYLDLVQIDLVDVSCLSDFNSGVNYLLFAIDCFTR